MAPVKRSSPDELFLIRFVVEPDEGNPEASECGGAYANCWMDADDLRTSEERALRTLREELWRPIKLEHWEIVCRRCYSEDLKDDGELRYDCLQSMSDAFEHGIAIMFHSWAKDAPDGNQDP